MIRRGRLLAVVLALVYAAPPVVAAHGAGVVPSRRESPTADLLRNPRPGTLPAESFLGREVERIFGGGSIRRLNGDHPAVVYSARHAFAVAPDRVESHQTRLPDPQAVLHAFTRAPPSPESVRYA